MYTWRYWSIKTRFWTLFIGVVFGSFQFLEEAAATVPAPKLELASNISPTDSGVPDEPSSVSPTYEGGFLISGFEWVRRPQGTRQPSGTAAWFVKVNNANGVVWRFRQGPTSGPNTDGTDFFSRGRGAVALQDGSAMLCIVGHKALYVVTLNAKGKAEANRTFQLDPTSDARTDIIAETSGCQKWGGGVGFVASVSERQSVTSDYTQKLRIIRLSAGGNVEVDETLPVEPGKHFGRADVGPSFESRDGGFVFAFRGPGLSIGKASKDGKLLPSRYLDYDLTSGEKLLVTPQTTPEDILVYHGSTQVAPHATPGITRFDLSLAEQPGVQGKSPDAFASYRILGLKDSSFLLVGAELPEGFGLLHGFLASVARTDRLFSSTEILRLPQVSYSGGEQIYAASVSYDGKSALIALTAQVHPAGAKHVEGIWVYRLKLE